MNYGISNHKLGAKMPEYKVKDLKNGMKNVDITVTIDFMGYTNKGDISYGDSLFVQAYVRDETGEIKMVFWEDDARKVKEGKKVKVTNGYISEYRKELQINAGKEGKIEFVKK